MKYKVEMDQREEEITLDQEKGRASLNGTTRDFEISHQSNGSYLLRIGKKTYRVNDVETQGNTMRIRVNGEAMEMKVLDEHDLLLEKMGMQKVADGQDQLIKAPMPGKILDILVEEGSEVNQGDPVAILEAMKMENELKSPAAGIVKQIFVDKNQTVEKNDSLIEIDSSG